MDGTAPDGPGQPPATPGDLRARLDAQLDLQVAALRRRMGWWPLAVPVAGCLASGIGLVATTLRLRAGDPATRLDAVFVAGLVLFGMALALAVVAPRRLRPRIVPCFRAEVARWGGVTSPAFLRGRALFENAESLEAEAARLGVAPLSAFGFDDDLYDQPIAWHPGALGLRSARALLSAAQPESDVARDLDALARALAAAAERGIDFALVLRLHATESMQGVMTREVRSGSLW